MKRQLGQLLVEAGLIDDIQLTVALGMQKKTGLRLGNQLLKLGFIRETELSAILRKQLGIKVALTEMKIARQAIDSVPQELAFKFNIMPLAYDGKTITIATTKPSDLAMLDTLAFQLGKRLKPVLALEWDIDNALIKNYLSFSDDELEKLTHISSSALQYEQMDDTLGGFLSFESTSYADESAASRLKEGIVPGLEPTSQQAALKPPPHSQPGGQAGGPSPSSPPLQPPQTQRPSSQAPPAGQAPPTGQAPPASQAPPVRPAPPATEPQSGEKSVRRSMYSHKRATLQHALIELLIHKKVITERELLSVLMKVERVMPDDPDE